MSTETTTRVQVTNRAVMESLVGRKVIAQTYEGAALVLTVEPVGTRDTVGTAYLTGLLDNGVNWMRLDTVVTVLGEAPVVDDSAAPAPQVVEALHVHEEGRVACAEHGGTYLASALATAPYATQHRTPLGRWTVLAGHAALGMACEHCGAVTAA